ncbi:hypothetical protein RRG08_058949 [Elysia crispata]|uniref:ADP-ribosylation factor n=1 Tax=Elysia crispata TaxID=231223 RepID=A0AAE1CKT4_9GAST|nr:hypothetical protein RRG08_058949 [Elysia crispata]
MGVFASRVFQALQRFSSGGNIRVLLLGLDAAGKTTILYKVKLNETVYTIPTIGFNVESLSPVKGLNFIVWDVAGQDKFRYLWRYYYTGTQGLLYVVDSADRVRLEEAREELLTIIKSPDMERVPLVVVANKQDMTEALTTSEVADGLGLREITDRKWYVQGACAETGDGIYESMQEMARLVKEVYKK